MRRCLLWCGNIRNCVGLLEATEVVEPNPISPNESTSYSNLYHCDRDGVYLYMDTVSRQIEDAIRKSEE